MIAISGLNIPTDVFEYLVNVCYLNNDKSYFSFMKTCKGIYDYLFENHFRLQYAVINIEQKVLDFIENFKYERKLKSVGFFDFEEWLKQDVNDVSEDCGFDKYVDNLDCLYGKESLSEASYTYSFDSDGEEVKKNVDKWSPFDNSNEIVIAGSYLLRDVYRIDWTDIDIFVEKGGCQDRDDLASLDNRSYWIGDDGERVYYDWFHSGMSTPFYTAVAGVISTTKYGCFNLIEVENVYEAIMSFDFSPLTVYYDVIENRLRYRVPANRVVHYNRSVFQSIIGGIGDIGKIPQIYEEQILDADIRTYPDVYKMLFLYALTDDPESNSPGSIILRLKDRYKKYKSRHFRFPYSIEELTAIIILVYYDIFLKKVVTFFNDSLVKYLLDNIFSDLSHNLLVNARKLIKLGEEVMKLSDLKIDDILNNYTSNPKKGEKFTDFIENCDICIVKLGYESIVMKDFLQFKSSIYYVEEGYSLF